MRRFWSISITVLLGIALVIPSSAFAAPGGGEERGKGAKERQASDTDKGRDESKDARKAERKAVRAEAKETRRAENSDRKSARETTRGIESTRSVEATPAVSNAFSRITSNIEKSLAKIADGRKKQVPPGLIRVWLKFAGWLGVDPSTMPTAPVGPPTNPTGEPTSTVEPTGTVGPDLTGSVADFRGLRQ